MKIAFLGAGSFVVGPSMLRQTILDKQAGIAALEECLRVHADLLGAWT